MNKLLRLTLLSALYDLRSYNAADGHGSFTYLLIRWDNELTDSFGVNLITVNIAAIHLAGKKVFRLFQIDANIAE